MQANRVPRKSRKRQQIIETAKRLFLKYGIRRITVEEICQQAGVSKMTFYRHFRNKQALALHIWQIWIEQSCEQLDAICALPVPFPEKLQRMLEYKLQWTERMSEESISEFVQHTHEIDYSPLLERFLDFFREAQEQGEIRAGVRPEFIVAAREKLAELAQDGGLVHLYPSYADFVREVWDFFFYGVLTRTLPED